MILRVNEHFRPQSSKRFIRQLINIEVSVLMHQIYKQHRNIKTVRQSTHNKTFKYVPALRASTGRKNAAHSYAALLIRYTVLDTARVEIPITWSSMGLKSS